MENMNEVNVNSRKSQNKAWILIVILIAALALLAWLYLSTRSRLGGLLEEKEMQRVEQQHELDSLIMEHNNIKIEYAGFSDSLLAKDSIIQANALEIRKLLDTQYEFYKVKKKLDKLRSISQGYLKQIDSLYTVNHELREENQEIRSSYQKEQQKTSTLQKDKEALTEKVSSAAFLKAYKITAIGVRGNGDKEKEMDRARKVEKIKVCYTLGENPLLSAGAKKVYIRISRPDKLILTQGIGDDYSFSYKGEIMQYTMRSTINYQNKAMDVCEYWINRSTKENLPAGVYVVSVYADDFEIGQTSFELR